MDAMKGFYPAFSSIESAALEHTLKVIGENNVAIEINTSGNTKDCGGWYPSDEILERALFYGVNVTFGPMHMILKELRMNLNWSENDSKKSDLKTGLILEKRKCFLTLYKEKGRLG